MAFPTKPRSQYNVYVVWSCLPIGWLEEFGQVSQRVSKDFVKVESLKRRLKLQSILFPQEKREGVAMDLRFGPEQDIMSDIGYANMIYQILKPQARCCHVGSTGLQHMDISVFWSHLVRALVSGGCQKTPYFK